MIIILKSQSGVTQLDIGQKAATRVCTSQKRTSIPFFSKNSKPASVILLQSDTYNTCSFTSDLSETKPASVILPQKYRFKSCIFTSDLSETKPASVILSQ